MSDLITAEEAHEWLKTSVDHGYDAQADLARTVIALHSQLADAQEAMAMVVELAYEAGAKAVHNEWMRAHEAGETPPRGEPDFSEAASDYAVLAHIDGLALVRELRADVERLNRWRAEEGEKIERQAKALTDLTKHCQRIEAENAGLARKIGKVQRGDGDHSQIADLEAKVINQRNELANLRARDGRLAELAVERDRLAAANAVLEAKVAGLVEALEPSAETKAAYMGEFYMGVTLSHPRLGEEMRKVQIPWTTIKEVMAAIRDRAALATQEAGNG